MTGSADLRLGIDVGGTNTDAVVLDSANRVLAQYKAPTSADLRAGIDQAMKAVVGQLPVPVQRITHVMLGTTQATNAILERRGLLPVGVVRIGAPATLSVLPMCEWPEDLRRVVSAGYAVIPGGSEVNRRELVPLGLEELRWFLDSIAGKAQAIAITGVFSPISADHELRAAEMVRDVLGDIPVSLSHGIGTIGLLERENACILNSALIGVAHKVVDGLRRVMYENQIEAVAFLTQNDGTLMGLDYALRYPVLTIGSGPANSMRGAAFLTRQPDALVVDVGGTSSDIGVLVNGFPRESTQPVDIGGVHTNFRMPDVVSVAVGGGTVVREIQGKAEVGPDSVGYRLTEEALVFGGSTATLSDAAVADGRLRLGHVPPTADAKELLRAALNVSDALLEAVVDQVKLSRQKLPLVVVGGASGLLPDDIDGVQQIIRPEFYEVANAIGAAIATVSGQVDRIYKLDGRDREDIQREACAAACDEAIGAGADPSQVSIIEIEEIPVAYLTEPIIRIRVRAAGPLDMV